MKKCKQHNKRDLIIARHIELMILGHIDGRKSRLLWKATKIVINDLKKHRI